jgi:hypothetical protein
MDVFSPEEIAMVQESRRRKGKSTALSAPALDRQSSVYCGPSTSVTQSQSSVTPSAPLRPFPSSLPNAHPNTEDDDQELMACMIHAYKLDL